ncbi:hypothetical protein [Pseudomonas sp.]|uniref:hypothetical protein n=1 Tax=Pseudomonas sp. TaxID=306 RepID=UPI002EDB5A50
MPAFISLWRSTLTSLTLHSTEQQFLFHFYDRFLGCHVITYKTLLWNVCEAVSTKKGQKERTSRHRSVVGFIKIVWNTILWHAKKIHNRWQIMRSFLPNFSRHSGAIFSDNCAFYLLYPADLICCDGSLYRRTSYIYRN